MQTAAAKALKGLIAFIAIALLLFIAYTWGVLSWSYSAGERAGYVQKFSHKGWVCKTWEGEMVLISMPGTVAEKFYFTVRDPAVAAEINRIIPLGKPVALTYEQHIGVPTSCFGDTQYFVASVRTADTPAAR